MSLSLYCFCRGGVGVGDGAADGVAQIDLAFEQVVPERRAGVFEVGHEDFGAGVEGVDDHLAIDGAGDFDAAIHEVGGQRGNGPCGFANVFCVGEEVRLFAGVNALLPLMTRGKQCFAARVEGALQIDNEGHGLGGENFSKTIAYRRENLDTGQIEREQA